MDMEINCGICCQDMNALIEFENGNLGTICYRVIALAMRFMTLCMVFPVGTDFVS